MMDIELKDSEKKLLRKEMKILRDGLSPSYRTMAAGKCQDLLFSSPLFQKAEWIFTYCSFGSELDTKGIIVEALSQGKRVAVPKVSGRTMDFLEIRSMDDLEPGIWGIPEPVAGRSASPFLTSSSFTLMLMPGLAFDRQGGRLGYGGGYYDRYLGTHKGLVKAGLAFPEQLVGQVPYDKHDQKTDYIITSHEIIPFR